MPHSSGRYQEALDRLGGLKGLMRGLGHGPKGDRWSSFACPFCQKKAAGVFKPKEGIGELFKCHHSECISGGQAFNAIGYIGFFFGLSEQNPEPGRASPAYQKLLELAGLWEEGAKAAATATAAAPRAGRARGKDASGPRRDPPEAPPEDHDEVEPEDVSQAFREGEAPGGGTPPSLAHGEAPVFGEDLSDREDEEELGAPASDARGALRWFLEHAILTEADQEMLWTRRGILPQIAQSFCLRSNRRENLDLLQQARAQFGLEACLEAGLWQAGGSDWEGMGERSEGSGGEPRANEFFHGKGVVGTERDEHGKKRHVYGWNNPILIPYFDTRLDKGRAESPIAIVTEGEFKAIALHQVLNGGEAFALDPNSLVAIRPHKHWGRGAQPWCYLGPGGKAFAVAALPGITFCKREGDTWKVRYLLDCWLDVLEVRDVVVAYDNEEKKNANGSRHDSVIYAVWLARDLSIQGWRGRWAQIPESLRDSEGKADWDNVLARAVAGHPPTDWPELQPGIARTWKGWLGAAVDMRQDTPIQVRFDNQVLVVSVRGVRRLELPASAEAKLRRISYVYRLPRPGGEGGAGRLNTVKIGRRLLGIARLVLAGKKRTIGEREAGEWLRDLGSAYLKLEGGYFSHHPCKAMPMVKRAPKPSEREFWLPILEAAKSNGDVDAAWAAEMALRGRPERFTDFVVEPLYKVRKADGEYVRIVNIINRYGERTIQLELPGEQYSSPTRLREWLNCKSDGGSWSAGERELQAGMEDWNAMLAHRTVREVSAWGWCPDAKAWFVGDCAIDAGGIHQPNRYGYYQLKTGKWQVGRMDREGNFFFQSPPSWHPERQTKQREVGRLLVEFIECLQQAIGGMHAHLALGIIFAYAAAPEVFNIHHCFPGLWIHGEASQGKTTIARWLMRLVGFPFHGRHGGVSLESSSGPGGALVMQQFSNLPVWFEEAQGDTRADLLRLLKDTFNRIGGAKALATGMREILTAPMVIGQATSHDQATRTRYPHVLVSASRRMPAVGQNWEGTVLDLGGVSERHEANYARVEALLDSLYLIFRELVIKREQFAKVVLESIAQWLQRPEVRPIEARTALVRGVALGGFAGALEVCGVSELGYWMEQEGVWRCVRVEVGEFLDLGLKPFLLEEAFKSVSDIRESGEIEEFLRAVTTCWERGGFGDNRNDWRGYFNATFAEFADPPGVGEDSTQRGKWQQVSLYINTDAVLDALAEYLRRQNKTLKLRRDDLRAQMSVKPWWIRRGDSKVRFLVNGASSTRRAWGFNLDLVPEFGYRPLSDGELAIAYPADPRKGPLYAIAEAIAGETT